MKLFRYSAALEILVFAELGGFLIAANSDGAELDRPAIEHPARRLRRLFDERRGGYEQSRRSARIHGDAQPLGITFDNRADGPRIQGVAGRGVLPP